MMGVRQLMRTWLVVEAKVHSTTMTTMSLVHKVDTSGGVVVELN